MKTKGRNRHLKKRSLKNFKKSNHGYGYSPEQKVLMFLQMLNTIKLYHWKTSSFAEHKATDDLYAKLNGTIDTFVEIMLGKGNRKEGNRKEGTGTRVNLTSTKHIPLSDFSNSSELRREVEMYKQYLIKMPFQDTDTDLLNTRDEMLGHLNQFTYLLTFT
jgi:hypothetical protein